MTEETTDTMGTGGITGQGEREKNGRLRETGRDYRYHRDRRDYRIRRVIYNLLITTRGIN